MIASKAWRWNKVENASWNEPADDVYYLISRWNQHKRKKILDVGCGIGRHAILFAEHGFIVNAFDLSNSGVSILAANTSKMNLKIDALIGDMHNFPYQSSTFSYALAYKTIYHTDKKGIEKVLAEIYRTLMYNGEVYLTLNSKKNPSFYDPRNLYIAENTLIKKVGKEAGIPHYYVDEPEIRRLLKDFTIIKFKYVEKIKENNRSCRYHLLAKKI